MYYLLLDIETSGLKKDNQYPNIVQIAFQMISYENSTSRFYLVDEDSYNSVKLKHSFIIKPSGYEISFEDSLIHGITNKYALDNGVELTDVISRLNGYIHDYQPILIAHNTEFDIDILKYYGLSKYVSYFCTMKYLSDIKFKENDKYLKLTELYTTLFNKEIIQEHDALKDVEILYDCLKELFALKILNEYKIKEVSNRISFQHFFYAFNKLKVLKSNVNLTDRFYGLTSLNGASFYAVDTKYDECTYLAFKEVDGVFNLALMSSCQVGILKYLLEVYDNYDEHSHLNKQECLKTIYNDLSELDYNNKVLKHRFINEYHNNVIIGTENHKLKFNNSFFIGNRYKVDGEEVSYYVEPTWENLHENDVIGFIDDNCIAFLIKNDRRKFVFKVSSKTFVNISEISEYAYNHGQINQYVSIVDFKENDNSILKYFNQLAN